MRIARSEQAKVSVITVVLNAASKMESTIKSVLGQEYSNLEYIVIDGGSTDGTLDIVSRYKDRISVFISERDEGIYDAFNKGVMLATGEWIGIMNAGDEFAGSDVLSRIFDDERYSNVDVIYGDAISVDGDVESYEASADSVQSFENGPAYRQGASFVRQSVHRKYLFDLSKRRELEFALDYEQMYRMYKGGCRFKKVPLVVIKYELRGVSTVSPFKITYYSYLITHGMKCAWGMKFILGWLTLWRGGKAVIKRNRVMLWRCLSSVAFGLLDFLCTCAAWLVFELVAVAMKMIRVDKACERKRIIVFANQAIGDTVIKIPFFEALRNLFPSDQYCISVVLSPSMAPVFSQLSFFDEVIAETIPPCKHVIFWVMGLFGFASKSLRWALRNKAEIFIACDRYRDLGLDFARCLSRPSLSLAYDSSLIGSIFPMSARLQKRFYDKRYSFLQHPSFDRHQIDDMFAFLSFSCGRTISPSAIDTHIFDPLLDLTAVDSLGLRNMDYTVLVPGAGAPYRRWPTQRFGDLANRLGGVFVIVGTRDETPLADEISSTVGSKCFNMCGRTNIRQLLGLLSGARIVIANETGTANCAAVLGAKTVCILGGGDFGSFFPNRYCLNSRSVFHRKACFSCGWKCSERSLANLSVAPCIDSIAVDDVIDATNDFH